jgi:hypothetical protein
VWSSLVISRVGSSRPMLRTAISRIVTALPRRARLRLRPPQRRRPARGVARDRAPGPGLVLHRPRDQRHRPGVAVTVLQMASVYATVATKRVLRPPTLLRGMVDAAAGSRRPTASRAVGCCGPPPARSLSRILEGVVADGGTGYPGRARGVGRSPTRPPPPASPTTNAAATGPARTSSASSATPPPVGRLARGRHSGLVEDLRVRSPVY